jgi:hypothetical protein
MTGALLLVGVDAVGVEVSDPDPPPEQATIPKLATQNKSIRISEPLPISDPNLFKTG